MNLRSILNRITSIHQKQIDTLKARDLHCIMKAVERLQTVNPRLYLAGSVALMASGLLPERKIGDIDFVINEEDFKDIELIKNIRMDTVGPYAEPKHLNEGYTSYHGVSGIYSINLLVYNKDVEITHEVLNYENKDFLIQKLDNILYWKEKYNRDKDIKDLEIINTILLEKAFFQEDSNER